MFKRSKQKLFADNHVLDKFYLEFENKFRGSEADIEKNVTFYAELLKREGIDYDKYPILDIGCGRGELITVLKRYSLRATGIDINRAMVKRARSLGLDVHQADAVKYLARSGENSFGAITGMHIIEHIPFDALLELFDSTFKALVPGGVAAFETPNPENLLVGTYSFYMDPSHLHPLPPPLIVHAMETVGFNRVEVIYRHDAGERTKKYTDPLLIDLQNKLRGPLDYAVVAHKPEAA